MGKPTSLLEDARAFAKDYARDRMPRGVMWDLIDYVPAFLDAQLTGRGGWKWASDVLNGEIQGGIFASFTTGPRLLLVSSAGTLYGVNLTTGALTNHAVTPQVRQNPVQHRDRVIIPQKDGAHQPYVATATASTVSCVPLPGAPTLFGKYAAVYKDRTLLGNAPGMETRLAFSKPGDPTVAWDDKSYINTSLPLTGIGALRSVILLFHEGSIERIRGAIPPTTEDPRGDMFMENMFDRAGCGDARSIAYWQDNCLFADERGVYLTDGAIVRNLASQGGILYFWRTLYRDRLTVAADTFLDYYLITVVRTTGEAVTLICDLQRRSWLRFNNIGAICYIHSVGAQEQLWAGRRGTNRLMALANCFFPASVEPMTDADETPVLPSFETPWYRFTEEGRKRVRFAYLSYDIRTTSDVGLSARAAASGQEISGDWRGQEDSEGQVLEPFTSPEQAEVAALAANGEVRSHLQALELGYITSPQETAYAIAGRLPDTTKYTRHRLPVGKNPYGVAFRVRQLVPSYVTRIYDLAAEAQPGERSRI